MADLMKDLTPDPVELVIGGERHAGWTSLAITRSIETIAGTFELTLTDRWPGAATRPPVHAGAPCLVRIGKDVVITGFIDSAEPSIDATSHSIRVRGRDASGDLVDCSAVQTPGQWKGQTLTQLCDILCAPFGIVVMAETDVGKPFASFALNDGETVFEAIERACRMRAVLAVSNGRGGVRLVRADTARRSGEQLTTGANGTVLAASGGEAMGDRYSTIIVKGQSQGGDSTSPEDNAEPAAEASDPAVSRYRPLIVLAEDQGSAADFQDRARWEASVRRGRARKAQVTVQGWRRHNAALWQPLQIVGVDIPEIGLAADMLISAVRFTLDAQGRRTQLTLAPQKAFELIAIAVADDKAATW